MGNCVEITLYTILSIDKSTFLCVSLSDKQQIIPNLLRKQACKPCIWQLISIVFLPFSMNFQCDLCICGVCFHCLWILLIFYLKLTKPVPNKKIVTNQRHWRGSERHYLTCMQMLLFPNIVAFHSSTVLPPNILSTNPVGHVLRNTDRSSLMHAIVIVSQYCCVPQFHGSTTQYSYNKSSPLCVRLCNYKKSRVPKSKKWLRLHFLSEIIQTFFKWCKTFQIVI